MPDEYLNGFITVNYGTDTVSLRFKIKGRFAQIDLGEGDLIKVQEEENSSYKVVTIEEILNRTVNKISNRHTEWNQGQSFYEACRAKVRINPETNRYIEFLEKKGIIKALFKAVEMQELSHEKATRTLMNWEKAYNE